MFNRHFALFDFNGKSSVYLLDKNHKECYLNQLKSLYCEKMSFIGNKCDLMSVTSSSSFCVVSAGKIKIGCLDSQFFSTCGSIVPIINIGDMQLVDILFYYEESSEHIASEVLAIQDNGNIHKWEYFNIGCRNEWKHYCIENSKNAKIIENNFDIINIDGTIFNICFSNNTLTKISEFLPNNIKQVVMVLEDDERGYYILLEDGIVYSCNGNFEDLKIVVLPNKIMKLTRTPNFEKYLFAITDDGQVFSFENLELFTDLPDGQINDIYSDDVATFVHVDDSLYCKFKHSNENTYEQMMCSDDSGHTLIPATFKPIKNKRIKSAFSV